MVNAALKVNLYLTYFSVHEHESYPIFVCCVDSSKKIEQNTKNFEKDKEKW